jgi:hypothetical protein
VNSEEVMAQDTKPVALNTADARYLINQWGAHGFFRVRGLGGKIAVEEVVPCSSYTIRLRSQYEDRSVSSVTVPHAGGPVDDCGQRPDVWDLATTPPTDFQDRHEEQPIPHTDHVRPCPRCDSRGRVPCGKCQGFGQVACPRCNGLGYLDRSEMSPVQDGDGNTAMRPVNARETCTCFGGKIGCKSCKGQGTVTCRACKGHGRTRTFEQLDVHFRVQGQTEVLHATKIPDALLHQASGEVLVDDRAAPTVACPFVDAQVDGRVADVLQRSQAVAPDKTRLLFQHLHVEYVPVQEVRYRYRNSPLKGLWIYGKEQRIYAPGVPRPWAKLAAVGLVLLLVIVGVIALL